VSVLFSGDRRSVFPRNTYHSWCVCTFLFVVPTLTIVSLTAGPSSAQTTCSVRSDLASNAGVRWADLRAACEADQAAYKQKDLVGFNWFINAGNGFSGFPYVLQRILPELAPEIWGRPEENFARFGLFTDDNPKRPLPRGLGITSTAGRPVDANDDPTGEIDFATPGLHVVTLACGACHTGQVRTEAGIKIFDGAPNTQVDVRKWREAYGLTVQHYPASNRSEARRNGSPRSSTASPRATSIRATISAAPVS
jgi:hypothetical protein